MKVKIEFKASLDVELEDKELKIKPEQIEELRRALPPEGALIESNSDLQQEVLTATLKGDPIELSKEVAEIFGDLCGRLYDFPEVKFKYLVQITKLKIKK